MVKDRYCLRGHSPISIVTHEPVKVETGKSS